MRDERSASSTHGTLDRTDPHKDVLASGLRYSGGAAA